MEKSNQYTIRVISLFLFWNISLLLFAQSKGCQQYIFFSHAYDGHSFDNRLSQINIQNYNGIFMGGDILSEASLDRFYMSSLDSLVDLSNPMTLWALGNHDSRNGNWDWISQFTKRETFSAYYEDQSVFIVLNTNIVPYDCEDMEKQFSMISNVCDSIQESKNLFLFMHHIIWDGTPGLIPAWMVGHENLKYWLANCDSANAHFYNVVYPMLVEVKNRDIDVFCIGGDLGSGTKKKYQEQSSDQIEFLGCGLNQYSPNDLVLIFDNDEGGISFGFHNLDSLVVAQKKINAQ
ncbi:MAG: hypothetical protein GQ527_11215 [Bacteroidales bacterium]|nr:hypothetical protein [Bacteroidales bacterium]